VDVTAHGRTDVGRQRERNEDALLALTRVFAVADGMGGHRAGEVASATALEPLAALDTADLGDEDAARTALVEAVLAANRAVASRAQDEPDLEGMGTTLTAVLVHDGLAHVAHVGDSRAYLWRGGALPQLTDDHTLVQALVDQGRITADQARVHHSRSVITRAIGVGAEVEVDVLAVPLAPGDRLLLCSDGLSGVVDDGAIAEVLAAHADGDAATAALVEAANAGGGPDNITVLLVDARASADAATTSVPAAAPRTPIVIRSDGPVRHRAPSTEAAPDAGWAAQVGRLAGGGAPRPAEGPGWRRLLGRGERLALRALVAVATLAVLAGGVATGAQFLLSRAYLVGVAGDEVVIFRGLDVQVGPVDLRRVHERPGVRLVEVPPALRPVFEAGRPAADLDDARRMVEAIPLLTAEQVAAEAGG
jgi:serine/threonine protein phosphatase PrpC